MNWNNLSAVQKAMYPVGDDGKPRSDLGWFTLAFVAEYRLHPMLNLLSKHTEELINGKSTADKLIPALSRHADLALQLGQLAMGQVPTRQNAGSAIQDSIQEIWKVLRDDATLGKRVGKKAKRLFGKRRLFAGVSGQLQGSPNLPSLRTRSDGVDGDLIGLVGTLCRVDALRTFNRELADRLPKSNLYWVITDLPPFAMVEDVAAYEGEVVALRIDKRIRKDLEKSTPFSAAFDWYPYVQVYGEFREKFVHEDHVYDNTVIDLSWLTYRRPVRVETKIIEGFTLARLLDQALHPVFGDPRVDLNDSRSALLFLSAIQICLAANSAKYESESPFGKLVTAVVTHADTYPTEMKKMFGL